MSIQSNKTHDGSIFPIQDDFLNLLQDYANESISDTLITLVVGGLLISGRLATHREYSEYFAQVIGKQIIIIPKEKGADDNNYHMELLKEKYQSSEHFSIGYINLKNAQIFYQSGNPIPSDKTIFWRGKIESVDGFFLGGLSAQ